MVHPASSVKEPPMKKTAALLAGVILPLVASMGIATSSNAQSPTNDEAYCQALINKYTHGGMERGFSPESLDTSVAINQCRDGNPRPAIPVLEEKLLDDGYSLPPRS
jgi:hypothetical protein